MSSLTTLSDAELDVVSGGLTINLLGGANGGSAQVGANLVARASKGGEVEIRNVTMNVSNSTANANGGTGGNISITFGD